MWIRLPRNCAHEGIFPLAYKIISDPKTRKFTSCTQPLGPRCKRAERMLQEVMIRSEHTLHQGNHREDDGPVMPAAASKAITELRSRT